MNKPILILLIASLFISCITFPVQAEIDGNMLLDHCGEAMKYIDNRNDPSINSASVNFCIGFISGVDNLHKTFTTSVSNFDAPVYCAPSPANLEQYVEIIVNYLKAHPNHLYKEGSFLMLSALKETFPCSNNTPQQ